MRVSHPFKEVSSTHQAMMKLSAAPMQVTHKTTHQITSPVASSYDSISSSGRCCPNVFAKSKHVFRPSACCCNRTKYICDVCFSHRLGFPLLLIQHFCIATEHNITECTVITNVDHIPNEYSLYDTIDSL